MDKFKEIPDKMQCPCGSGKLYEKCCKKKNFKFGYNGKEIVKQIPIHEELIPVLEETRTQFTEYYGRAPGSKDYVMAFAPIYNDDLLLQTMYLFRKIGFPENKIYAYYKSDGLFPCDLNVDLLPETEIKEFSSLCKEYDDCISGDVEGDQHINAIKYVMASNSYIEEQVDYVVESIISALNDFIRRHSENTPILEYQIANELDYCIFSALKTVKTLQSVIHLKENHLAECIYALSRGIFENYMYMCNINSDPALFYDKLLPKVDEENYTFAKRSDGKIDFRSVINRHTGKKTSVRISISDLKEKQPYDTDRDLYAIFYQTACQYVHVDIMSAKSYFSVANPYDEIDRSLIAALITLILAELLLLQISQNTNVLQQYKNDILFLCANNLNSRLAACLKIANNDPEHQNVILELLLKRMKEQFPDLDNA
ncbi:MAG: DUF5677 domain-containing protein [Oscillospiraceae bacterium]|jgi:hypothetical protein|nr:DUF5677 domain-containing protein [Oscillospiraceae bacterium]